MVEQSFQEKTWMEMRSKHINVLHLSCSMFNVHAVLDQFIPHTLTKCQTVFRRNKNYDYYTIIFFTPPLELRCNVKSR